MIKVAIPVEPHVLKFLVKKYGLCPEVSKNNLLGVEVLRALTKKYEKPESFIPNTFRYTVQVGEFYFNTKGHTISRNNRQHLGIVLGKLFDEAMCDHLDMAVSRNRKAMTELKYYLKFYGITEEDAKLESLYKVYQRHCRGPIKQKKTVV